jgi:hypothetical protein
VSRLETSAASMLTFHDEETGGRGLIDDEQLPSDHSR